MSPEMRIGDAEREGAVAALGEHYAAGRLTKEEYDERAERAWAARTASQVAPLFADLPAPHGRPAPASRSTAPSPSAPSTAAERWRARSGGWRPPLLPMALVFVGVALLVGHFWVFWVLLGLFWWSGARFRRARRREWAVRQGWPGWAGHPHRPPRW